MVKAGFGGGAPTKNGGWGGGAPPHYKQFKLQAQPFNIQFNERIMTVTRARFRSHIPCATSRSMFGSIDPVKRL